MNVPHLPGGSNTYDSVVLGPEVSKNASATVASAATCRVGPAAGALEGSEVATNGCARCQIHCFTNRLAHTNPKQFWFGTRPWSRTSRVTNRRSERLLGANRHERHLLAKVASYRRPATAPCHNATIASRANEKSHPSACVLPHTRHAIERRPNLGHQTTHRHVGFPRQSSCVLAAVNRQRPLEASHRELVGVCTL